MPKKIDLNGNSTNLSITIEGLQALVDRYKHERYVFITQHLDPDSRAVWISKNKLMELFDKNPAATGVRMYYGVIDDSFYGHHKSAHNLIFVSTRKGSAGNDDMTGNDDWVIVTQNVDEPALNDDPQCIICPPPQPCQGMQLNIIP
jgi:hypothetical protein